MARSPRSKPKKKQAKKRVPRGGPASGRALSQEGAVLAAALDPIITIDVRGTIQSASDSVERVLGWAAAELIGRNVNVLMPEPHHSSHDGYLSNYRRTGRTNILNRPRRFDARRKDGSTVPIELCVSRADLPGDAGPLFVGIIRDMTAYAAAELTQEAERVRSQELLAQQTSALQTAYLRLRMADRMASIGTLAAGLGHDRNNVLLPVRARLNALRAAAQAGAIPSRELQHVEEIRKSVAYLQQLADGLHFLALDPDSEDARGGSGESTELKEWWTQAGVLISKAVPKHVRVMASLPAGLPRAAVAPHRLTQAVLNLVVNAGEAIPPSGARKRRQGYVRLKVEYVMGSERVRISVTDNGMGMTEEVRRRAFEMFFTTKPRGLGTGLGLALVRRVAEQAGGEIAIDSQAGVGTTITIEIPVALQAGGVGRRVSGAISIGDSRAARLVRHVLEVSGIGVEEHEAGVGVWVVDPGVVNLARAGTWLKANPGGKLVVFGMLAGEEQKRWKALTRLAIERVDDVAEVRGVLGRAVAGLRSE